MKKTIEKFYCDICGAECENVKQITYPVVFLTDQTEGRSSKPYIDYSKLDVCENCCEKILKVSAVGAMGYNKYSLANFEIEGGNND